jgi:c-di-GMP-binding flagellar brake protein YcgR
VWLRYAANLDVRCEPINEQSETAISASISDLSRGGIQLIASRRFEPGSLLSIDLPAADDRKALSVLACVVRTHPVGESDWSMGCRFASELDEQQLQAFGAERLRPDSPDARGWSRFPCDARACYQRVNHSDQAHHAARVLNISVGGMALLTTEPIELGELLSTQLHDLQDKPIVNILACVVHAQKIAQGYLLGCNFIRELNDQDVRALL